VFVVFVGIVVCFYVLV